MDKEASMVVIHINKTKVDTMDFMISNNINNISLHNKDNVFFLDYFKVLKNYFINFIK